MIQVMRPVCSSLPRIRATRSGPPANPRRIVPPVQRDGRQPDQHAQHHAESHRAKIGLRAAADGVAEELRDGGEILAAGENADAIAELKSGVARGDEVHVAAAQARHSGPHAVLQVEFADALAHNLLAGNEHAAEVELRAVLFDMGLDRLSEDLFGTHQTVFIAHRHNDVVPLQSGVAAGDVAGTPVLDTADHKAWVTVQAQDFLHRAIDHGRIHHREITRADLLAFCRRLHLRFPQAE